MQTPDMNAYPASAIANYFIRRGISERQFISPMKAQKLVYFAHGWNLAIYDELLIDEQIQAWEYGPVIYSLYKQLKRWGSGEILGVIMEGLHTPDIADNPDLCNRTEALLDRIWFVYGGFHAAKLSAMTHLPNTPWRNTVEEAVERFTFLPKGTDIAADLIKNYFAGLSSAQSSVPQ